MSPAPLLEVSELVVRFRLRGKFFAPARFIEAVSGVSFAIHQGETLGLVGESGCGKTTVGRCVARLLEPESGNIHLLGANITHLSKRSLRAARRNVHIVFQDPYSSLNPRMTVDRILSGPLRYHGIAKGKPALERVAAMLDKVGLSPELGKRHPHRLSGGQRQRVAIARALIAGSAMIVADEPISALDACVQASILNLIRDLQSDIGFGCLFITHDLSAAEVTCQRLAVMYMGQLVELGPTKDLLADPKHPYTQALLSAVLVPDPAIQRSFVPALLSGEPPSTLKPPAGCRFSSRCPHVMSICTTSVPQFLAVPDTARWARCHLLSDAHGSSRSRPTYVGRNQGVGR